MRFFYSSVHSPAHSSTHTHSFMSRSLTLATIISTIVSTIVSTTALTGCQPAAQQETADYGKIHGETMGTTYHISFELPLGDNAPTVEVIQAQIDKQLRAFNNELSTWKEDSTISRFNQAPVGQPIAINQDFVNVYHDSKLVYQQSAGAFNPTVKPILELWGFGKEMRVDKLQHPPTQSATVKAKELVDFESIEVKDNHIRKGKEGVAIDFSAVAKGYGVDVIANVLKSEYRINNYMVEIGGEVATSGVNDKGQGWQIGIDAPILYSGVADRQLIASIRQPTDDKHQGTMHLATSGNYRNSIVFEGVRYSHTIDPHTGRPIVGGAPSVTVAEDTVALADAWATALTAMPYEKALKTAEDLDKAVLFVVLKDGIDANQPSHKIEDWQVVETEKMKLMRSGK